MHRTSPRRRRALGTLTALLAPATFGAVCVDAPRSAYAQAPPPQGDYAPEEEGAQAQEVPADDSYQDTDPSALTDFHATLDPHGTWIDDPTYGQIWVPNGDEVGPDFAPYVSEGSWAYDDDYVWMSNYDWGWVPFHYGRWAWTGGRWGWIPGRVYAGAWVSWRVGPEGYGYCGWGPMAPGFGWRGGAAFRLGAEIAARPGPMVFVPRDALFEPRVGARVVVGPRMATIAAETRPFGRAEAGLGGREFVRGPAPASLGIQASAVVPVDPRNPNVARARAFARPSTAVAAGARAPSGHRVRNGRPAGGGGPGGAERAVERGGERPVERGEERGGGERRTPAPRAGGGGRGGGGHGGRR